MLIKIDCEVRISRGSGAPIAIRGVVVLSNEHSSTSHWVFLLTDGSSNSEVIRLDVGANLRVSRAASGVFLINESATETSCLVTPQSETDFDGFIFGMGQARVTIDTSSAFSVKTEESSAQEYFKSVLSSVLFFNKDFTRTGTYNRAILANSVDFSGKVVCDVGTGSGILSFFAAQAGAKKVYAVEASNMAENARKLAESNGIGEIVEVIKSRVEELELPEQVDILISEPMGTMLVNERMLESYLHARKWLKPGGTMFPRQALMHVCPFSDEQLYMEISSKTQFWSQQSFFGVNLSCLQTLAQQEAFRQPIVECIDPRCLVGRPCSIEFDFLTMDEKALQDFTIPFQYTYDRAHVIHGIASWFDVLFPGTAEPVWLSTSPYAPLTHWYQIRVLFPKPILLHAGQSIKGEVHLVANRKQSYDIYTKASVDGTSIVAESHCDLKEPYFRFGAQFGSHFGQSTTDYVENGTIFTPATDAMFQNSQ